MLIFSSLWTCIAADVHNNDGPEAFAFTTPLLDRVKEILPSDLISFSEIDHSQRKWIAQTECSASPDAIPDELPELPPSSGSGAGSTRSASNSWRGKGIEDELWIDLSPSYVHTKKLLIGRCAGGFGERDRRVASLLQPHFVTACRNAAKRRLLTAALAATDAAHNSIVFLGADGEIEFVSGAAHDLLDDFFGSNGRLPKPLADWHRSRSTSPFVEHRGERCLIAESAGAGDTLLLREETSPGALTLTSREHDVVLLVAAGKSNKEIALDLWVTPATVKKHLEHVYKKLGVGSRMAAVARLALKPSA